MNEYIEAVFEDNKFIKKSPGDFYTVNINDRLFAISYQKDFVSYCLSVKDKQIFVLYRNNITKYIVKDSEIIKDKEIHFSRDKYYNIGYFGDLLMVYKQSNSQYDLFDSNLDYIGNKESEVTEGTESKITIKGQLIISNFRDDTLEINNIHYDSSDVIVSVDEFDYNLSISQDEKYLLDTIRTNNTIYIKLVKEDSKLKYIKIIDGCLAYYGDKVIDFNKLIFLENNYPETAKEKEEEKEEEEKEQQEQQEQQEMSDED